jgi:O-antigen/teichoic acid export membrane protein
MTISLLFAAEQPTQPQSPLMGLVLIASIIAAITDWRYKRRGGIRPTSKERIWFTISFLMPVLLLNWWFVHNGVSAYAVGRVVGVLLIIYFAVWEFGRWRVRRKNPA